MSCLTLEFNHAPNTCCDIYTLYSYQPIEQLKNFACVKDF